MIACAALIAGNSLPAAAAEGTPTADPPALVGRVARVSGPVVMRPPGTAAWADAVLNYPVTSGSAFWTGTDGQLGVEIGASRVALDSGTELDIATLDEQQASVSEPRGAVFLDLRGGQPRDGYRLATPRGAVRMAVSGEYEIVAGDAQAPTRVVVVRGAADLSSGDLSLHAGAGQMIVVFGSQPFGGEVQPMPGADAFLSAMLARAPSETPVPALAGAMTGGADLSAYGAWQASQDWGEAWFPDVGPDWVPYGDGQWSFVAPWGWTWIDAEPWGFAPFHYGRWARSGRRWCWVPGEPGARLPREPVYAPALVGFLRAGGHEGAPAAGRHETIGWVPLGPHELYRPPYHASRRYLDRLNDGGHWHQPAWHEAGHDAGERPGAGHPGFLNRQALSVAPAAAFIRSATIRHAAAREPGSFASGAAQPLGGGELPFHAGHDPAALPPGLHPAPPPPPHPALPRREPGPTGREAAGFRVAGPRVAGPEVFGPERSAPGLTGRRRPGPGTAGPAVIEPGLVEPRGVGPGTTEVGPPTPPALPGPQAHTIERPAIPRLVRPLQPPPLEPPSIDRPMISRPSIDRPMMPPPVFRPSPRPVAPYALPHAPGGFAPHPAPGFAAGPPGGLAMHPLAPHPFAPPPARLPPPR